MIIYFFCFTPSQIKEAVIRVQNDAEVVISSFKIKFGVYDN